LPAVGAAVVDDVVHELESDAELLAERGESALGFGRRAGEASPGTRREREERRGLVREDVLVGGFGDVELDAPAQLNDLALDQSAQRGDEIGHDLGCVAAGAVERVHQQHIAREHAHAVAPDFARSRLTAALVAVVDHIVVQQRRRVHQLGHHRELTRGRAGCGRSTPRLNKSESGRRRLPPFATRWRAASVAGDGPAIAVELSAVSTHARSSAKSAITSARRASARSPGFRLGSAAQGTHGGLDPSAGASATF
jgi:hypothetical protein